MVMRTGAGPVAIVSDRQGTFQTAVSTAGLWDQSFTVTASNLFGAKDGATRGSGGATGGAGFSGAGVSSSGAGFVYLRNRWYDPQSGRFLTQDPIGLAGGVNLYAYAGNNPVMFSDPFGLCPPEMRSDNDKCAEYNTAQYAAAVEVLQSEGARHNKYAKGPDLMIANPQMKNDDQVLAICHGSGDTATMAARLASQMAHLRFT